LQWRYFGYSPLCFNAPMSHDKSRSLEVVGWDSLDEVLGRGTIDE